MSKHNKFTGCLFVFLIIISLSCKNTKKEESEATPRELLPENIVEMRFDQIKLAGVDTGTIQQRYLYNTLNVNGLIAVPPRDLATVCSPLGGFVKNSDLLPGDFVEKGQTLATIENQELIEIQENYLVAKSRLAFAEAEYNRHTDLYKNEVYSEQTLQQSVSDYKSLKAQVSAYQQKLILSGIDPEKLTEDNISRSFALRAPIRGFIKAVNVNIGKSISPTDVLFEIVNNDNLFLELTLYEKDANKVTTGQKVKFFINNETEEHEGYIYQTGRAVSTDKTYQVFAKITTVCKNLLSGMYVNAVIETSGNKVPSLPSEAIVSFDDKDYIFVFEKNKQENGNPFSEYRMVEVKKGISENGYTEVILPEGFDIAKEKVVITGAYNLLSAMKNSGEMAC